MKRSGKNTGGSKFRDTFAKKDIPPKMDKRNNDHSEVDIPMHIVESIVGYARIPVLKLRKEHGVIHRLRNALNAELVRFYVRINDRELRRPPTADEQFRQIKALAAPAKRLATKVKSLPVPTKQLLAGLILRRTDGDDIQSLLKELEFSLRALSSADELVGPLIVKSKGGAPSKTDFSDKYGPFYLFTRSLIALIEWHGGSLTLVRATESGTLIDVLNLLLPFMPTDAVPSFLAQGSSKGIRRLDAVRSSASRKDAIRIFQQKMRGQKTRAK